MTYEPFYDPLKSYEANYEQGPFGAFADGKVYEQAGQPKHKFFGYPVYLPFGIAAGPLINGKYTKAALDKGFDIVVYKTVRSRPHPCHPWPNIVPVDVEGDLTIEKADAGLVSKDKYIEPLSITNSFGVPSQEIEVWQQDLADTVAHAKEGQIVVGSFQGTRQGDGDKFGFARDYALAAKLVKETGAKVLEANFSCPNECVSNLVCFDTDTVVRVCTAIKEEIGDTPLIIKAAYFRNYDKLKNLIKNVGNIVDGIATINTITSEIRTKDGMQALPGEGRLAGGVCGHSIKWAGLEMTGKLKKLREELDMKYTIIGVGGVTKPEDYKEYIEAGADAVMSATGAMWNPYLAQEIKKENQ